MIGKRISELRMSKTTLNQEQFAVKLNFDRTFLSRIESGKQNITIETLNTICEGLNVSLAEFFAPFNEIKEEKYEKKI